jgi:O-antigen ligase
MFGIIIALSLLFVVALPSYGISGGPHQGAWRGVFTHKNGFGEKMAIATGIFFLLGLSLKQYRWAAWVGLGMSVLLVILARTSSGLLSAMVPLILIPLAQTFRWRRELMMPAVVAVLAATGLTSYVIASNSDTILIALGEDPTLTGRTSFWPIIIDMIQQRPFLGYGYETFWLGGNPNSPAVEVAYATPGHTPSHAHNGLLQIWLHLGFVGVAVFLIGYWLTVLRSLAWIRLSNSAVAIWPLVYCALIVQFNVASTNVMEYNELSWILYVAAVLSVLYPPESDEQVRSPEQSTLMPVAG